MSSITAEQVAKLREMTGAGMMDAKKALVEAHGDVEGAVDVLRKSGALKAAKKADRATAEGRVHAYMHATGKLAVVVEVMCETDFVARNEAFVELAQDIALHIAANAPLYTSREAIPVAVVEKEKAFHREQLMAEGKPADMLEKVLEGKMNKFFAEVCLLDQPFVKDDTITVAQLLEQKILSIGESIKVGKFVRMVLGS